MARWKRDDISSDALYKQKRDALIREAAIAFGQRGYHATSLEEIAKKLDVTKAALYYYVNGKQEILYECHCISMNLAEEALQSALKSKKHGLDVLSQFINNYIQMITGEFGDCAQLSDLTALNELHREEILTRRKAFNAALKNVIRTGTEDGSIRPDADPHIVAFLILGAINWVPRWTETEDESAHGPDVGALFTDLVRRGIAA